MSLNKKLFIGIVGLLALTGCTVGQSEFNCSSGDENALCASSRTIYNASNGDVKENEKITYVRDGEVHQTTVSELEGLKSKLANGEKETDAVKEKASSTATRKQATSSRGMDVPLTFSYDGNVLRKDVKVMRIWVAPWVDKSDNLHLSSLIYTDIEKRKWEVGTEYQNQSGNIKPHLKASSKSATNTNAKQPKQYRPRAKSQQTSSNTQSSTNENVVVTTTPKSE